MSVRGDLPRGEKPIVMNSVMQLTEILTVVSNGQAARIKSRTLRKLARSAGRCGVSATLGVSRCG
jgi:hypothetical protein